MLPLRPVTTASQNWRLLTLSSSRPISPHSFPTFLLSVSGHSVSLSQGLHYRTWTSNCLFYSPTSFPLRFAPSSARSKKLHAPLPPSPPKRSSLTHTKEIPFHDVRSILSAATATMSSESDDDMPLARFNGRGMCILPTRLSPTPAPCVAVGRDVTGVVMSAALLQRDLPRCFSS